MTTLSDNLNLLSAYVIWNILVLNIQGKVNKIAIKSIYCSSSDVKFIDTCISLYKGKLSVKNAGKQLVLHSLINEVFKKCIYLSDVVYGCLSLFCFSNCAAISWLPTLFEGKILDNYNELIDCVPWTSVGDCKPQHLKWVTRREFISTG